MPALVATPRSSPGDQCSLTLERHLPGAIAHISSTMITFYVPCATKIVAQRTQKVIMSSGGSTACRTCSFPTALGLTRCRQ